MLAWRSPSVPMPALAARRPWRFCGRCSHARRARGRLLAAALELAEELAVRGVAEARPLLDAFFGEAPSYGLDSADGMAQVDGLYLDRYPVTNREYECMVPGHKNLRDSIRTRRTSQLSG